MTIISENIDEDKKTNTTHKKRGLQAEVSAIDGNSKRQKESHTSCLKLSKTPCNKFVGKNNAFTEDSSGSTHTAP